MPSAFSEVTKLPKPLVSRASLTMPNTITRSHFRVSKSQAFCESGEIAWSSESSAAGRVHAFEFEEVGWQSCSRKAAIGGDIAVLDGLHRLAHGHVAILG